MFHEPEIAAASSRQSYEGCPVKNSMSRSMSSRQHPSCLHLPASSRHQQQSSRDCHQPHTGMNKRLQQADNARPSFRARLECSTAEHGMQAARPQGQRRPAGCPCSTGRSGSCRDAAGHADTARCAGAGARGTVAENPKYQCRACRPRHHTLPCEHPTTADLSMQAPCSEGHMHPAGCPCSTGRSGSWMQAAACADTAESMGAGAQGGGMSELCGLGCA